MARIDIDIEDYLDEVSTYDLLSELMSRKNALNELKKKAGDFLKEVDTDELIDHLKDNYSKESLIKKILDIRPWHDKKRIIEEIESL